MPRRPRGLRNHHCYHVTHRCHKREFLFRFARHRDTYTSMLRETLRRFPKIDILNYVITSNHVHLLVYVKEGPELSNAMQFLQGDFGQYYNQHKGREGAFWRDRFHSTMIQSGEHLSQCLFYIDMNMVRAGVAEHPRDWKHGGYHELAGTRQRYRVINTARLLHCLNAGADMDSFRSWYKTTLDDKVAAGYHVREPYWTEAFAVGNKAWVQDVYRDFGFQRKKILEAASVALDGEDRGDREVAEEQELYYIEG
jgi:putative transposase